MRWLLLFVLALQVPVPGHPGHTRRADGEACRTSGADPCGCKISWCTHDDQGHLSGYEVNAACQNRCDKSKCTCHACVDEDCPRGQ